MMLSSESVTALSITNFDETASYECRVTNEHGSGYAVVSLCLQQAGEYMCIELAVLLAVLHMAFVAAHEVDN